jgi:hypothetical protein
MAGTANAISPFAFAVKPYSKFCSELLEHVLRA